jgi:hypothetical protein
MVEKRVAKEGCMDVPVCHLWPTELPDSVGDSVDDRAKARFETVDS